MNTKHRKSGFTLLEIIIVIIIIGVLASLALPRLFKTVEFSRSAEGLAAISNIRQSLERCYLQGGATYVGCDMTSIDLENPANSPNAHFGTYAVSSQSTTGYTITATRNTVDGGATTSATQVTQTAAVVNRGGSTAFVGLK